MSKANDFYPGTNERVCLITGSKEAITDICGFLTEKVKEKPDPNAKPAIDFDNKVTAERDKQMKVTYNFRMRSIWSFFSTRNNHIEPHQQYKAFRKLAKTLLVIL